jgi:hypothetical protein
MTLIFIIVTFTIQYYFVVRSFWTETGLTDDRAIRKVQDVHYPFIRLNADFSRIATYITQ